MRVLVIGAGMMAGAAAFDLARSERVQAVTLADKDELRLGDAVERVNRLTESSKVAGVRLDAADTGTAVELMRGHDGASIVLQMLISGEISKRGGIRQEIDVPAQLFLSEMAQRGLHINYRIEVQECGEEALAAAAGDNY